jgi:hypothetical protein
VNWRLRWPIIWEEYLDYIFNLQKLKVGMKPEISKKSEEKLESFMIFKMIFFIPEAIPFRN